MSLVRFHNVTKRFESFGSRSTKPESNLVLREVFFRLSQGERVGLIGKNGVGKTTVLKLILGLEEPTEGTVEIQEGARIGYFSQFSELNGELTLEQTLAELFTDIRAIETELARIASRLGEHLDGPGLDRLLDRQAALFEEMDRREGWTYHNRIDTVLTRLGFSTAHRNCPIDQLSGGWRNRAALAKILLEDPNVLLMDEPTNYLDVDGLTWLEEWLHSVRGAVIVVSHDRHFLDSVVTRIVEIENHHFQEYSGGFTQYVREKQTRLKTLERQFQHEEELLAFEAEAIVDRQEAARDPNQALKRRLANIKKQIEPRPVDRIVTQIYAGLHVPNKLCQVERISKAYAMAHGEQTLFRDLSFEIQRGDRIVTLGPNGCGKTTLLNVLAQIEPGDAGRITWGKAVEWSYYNKVFEELDLDDTVTHAVNVAKLAYFAPRKRVNRFLELFQFSEMDLTQRIGALSGGQRARVALALCLLSGASLIILDEPTNHLGLTSTQVMERALVHFPGAVVVASHDRFFIDKVATRLLVFQGAGRVDEIAGNWTMWQASQVDGKEHLC